MNTFIVLFLFFPILAAASDGVGIIVKVKDRKNVHAIDKIAHSLGLKKGYVSTHLNYLQYQRTQASGNVESFCEKFNRHSDVELCEVDQKAKPDVTTCDDLTDSAIVELSSAVQAALGGCRLYTELAGSPVNPTGATPFWAQEYTGADLVRADLQGITLARDPEALIDVLDTTNNNHGAEAASLIASPSPVGIIPSRSELTVFDLMTNNGYIENYDRYRAQTATPPQYISNSMSWRDSEVISDVVSEISRMGTVFVTSAGNDSTEVDAIKDQIADQIVIVGSSRPDGMPSDFSQYGPGVVISAPSDHSVLAFSNGAPSLFGGTSGAAPQVTGALAAFTLISDYDLTVTEAHNLLRKTAIKLPQSYTDPATHGAGNLNAYKISQIAQRLKANCAQESTGPLKQACLRRELENENNFVFPTADLSDVEATFPPCFSGRTSGSSSSCLEKTEALTRLRREALLHPENPSLWRAIACVYRQENYPTNANYYQLVADSVTSEGAQRAYAQFVRSERFDLEEDRQMLIAFAGTNPAFLMSLVDEGQENVVLNLIFRGGSRLLSSTQVIHNLLDHARTRQIDEAILAYLRRSSNGERHHEIISRMIRENQIYIFDLLRTLEDPKWGNHPQLAQQVVEATLAKDPNARNTLVYFLNREHWRVHPQLSELRARLEAQN